MAHTKAQDEQALVAVDKLTVELRDLDPGTVVAALALFIEQRGDLTEASLTELSNHIGRLGWDRGRMAA